jgi:hypothetical protein
VSLEAGRAAKTARQIRLRLRNELSRRMAERYSVWMLAFARSMAASLSAIIAFIAALGSPEAQSRSAATRAEY